MDTHKDVHVAAVVSPVGVLLGHRDFPASPAGYRQLVAWARGHGRLNRAGVEGTGSYGAALTRHLQAEAVTVIEVNRPDRAMRRRSGKTDAVGERGAATLKQWHILRKARCSPSRMTAVVQAILTLEYQGR